MEETPEQIIDDSIREFVHDHDDGVCKPTCYGCFRVNEGKRALALQREQIACFIEHYSDERMMEDLARQIRAGKERP